MISLPKEEEMGKPYKDLTEEEQEQVVKDYIIVQTPPGLEFMDDEDDEIVELSTEFQIASEAYNRALLNIVTGILFRIPFVTLLVLKIKKQIASTWWIVFVPAWIYLGLNLLGYFRCCCGTGAENEVAIDIGVGVESPKTEEVKYAANKNRNGVDFVSTNSPMKDLDESADQFEGINSKATTGSHAATREIPSASDLEDVVILEETNIENDYDEEYSNKDRSSPSKGFREEYQAEEKTSMEAQQKGCNRLCTATFQLIILSLIAAKLEQSYT